MLCLLPFLGSNSNQLYFDSRVIAHDSKYSFDSCMSGCKLGWEYGLLGLMQINS